jgi:DedD protein
MQIPSPDKAPPLPPPAKAVTPAQAGAQPPAQAVSPAQAGAQSPAPAVTPAPVGAQPAPKLQGFAVQVGAYRDEKTLEEARTKLAAAGLTHYTERLEGTQAGLTRLRAGPYATREAADNARAALKRASLDGQVVALP